ncbi:hypothetical protein ACXET9_01660 [Brachybacterium sp. DNPG3]
MRIASSGSGTAGMRRWCRSRSMPTLRGAAVVGLAAMLLAGCAELGLPVGGSSDGGAGTDAGTSGGASAEVTADAVDPALAAACTDFWGDPDYRDPLSRTVLDRAATAPEAGPDDPFFYAMTADDIDAAFADAPEEAVAASAVLADWFRTEPERGAEADSAAFVTAWEGVAGACAGSSAAATWAAGLGEDGTKPGALVCAEVFDTPSTLTVFANANVLTSNMFKLVGLSPREVPSDRMDDVRATSDLLATEIAAVDDEGIRAALEEVRAPFTAALDGDTWSEGLQSPLDQLGSACGAIGYDTPGTGEMGSDDETDDGGLV